MTETTKPAAKPRAKPKPKEEIGTTGGVPVVVDAGLTQQVTWIAADEPSPPMIFPAMLAILRDVAPIPKGQRNQQQGYAFRGIDDVMNSLHPLFAKHGVFVAPGVTDKEYGESESRSGTKMTDAFLTLSYRFYAEDGSFVDAEVAGESRDAANKATNQASSSAFKYLLLQMFVIPLAGTKEADHESPEAIVVQPAPAGPHPDTRAKAAVFKAAGSKAAAQELWTKICTDLKIAEGGTVPLTKDEEADLIIHQLRSYLPVAE